jgi:hypothetical protein
MPSLAVDVGAVVEDAAAEAVVAWVAAVVMVVDR